MCRVAYLAHSELKYPMQQIIKKGQENMSIRIVVSLGDEDNTIFERRASSFESAEEDLGKLERAVNRLEKEEPIKENI